MTDQPISKDSTAVMMWETGKSLTQDVEIKHCTYDMTDCYKIKTLPVILGVSLNEGYTTGGQNITVKGFGFDEGAIVATVDGKACIVTARHKKTFDCTSASTSSASVSAPQAGQHGVRRKLVNTTSYVVPDSLPSKDGVEMLAMQFETPSNNGDLLSNQMKAWFVAPETTKYKFYAACDNLCDLYFSEVANNVDSANIKRIIKTINWKNVR